MKKSIHLEPKSPPYHYLKLVLDHCPKAGSIYIQLWHEKDKNSFVNIHKKDVREHFLISLSKFRHDILLLVKEGLVNVEETPEVMHIELVDWQEPIDAEGFPLC